MSQYVPHTVPSTVTSVSHDLAVSSSMLQSRPSRQAPVSVVACILLVLMGGVVAVLAIEIYRLRVQMRGVVTSHSARLLDELVRELPLDVKTSTRMELDEFRDDIERRVEKALCTHVKSSLQPVITSTASANLSRNLLCVPVSISAHETTVIETNREGLKPISRKADYVTERVADGVTGDESGEATDWATEHEVTDPIVKDVFCAIGEESDDASSEVTKQAPGPVDSALGETVNNPSDMGLEGSNIEVVKQAMYRVCDKKKHKALDSTSHMIRPKVIYETSNKRTAVDDTYKNKNPVEVIRRTTEPLVQLSSSTPWTDYLATEMPQLPKQQVEGDEPTAMDLHESLTSILPGSTIVDKTRKSRSLRDVIDAPSKLVPPVDQPTVQAPLDVQVIQTLPVLSTLHLPTLADCSSMIDKQL